MNYSIPWSRTAASSASSRGLPRRRTRRRRLVGRRRRRPDPVPGLLGEQGDRRDRGAPPGRPRHPRVRRPRRRADRGSGARVGAGHPHRLPQPDLRLPRRSGDPRRDRPDARLDRGRSPNRMPASSTNVSETVTTSTTARTTPPRILTLRSATVPGPTVSTLLAPRPSPLAPRPSPLAPRQLSGPATGSGGRAQVISCPSAPQAVSAWATPPSTRWQSTWRSGARESFARDVSCLMR